MNNYQVFLDGVYDGDLEKIKKYINKDNINLPLPDFLGQYPIHAAFETREPKIVKYFIDLGASLDVISSVRFLSNSTIEYEVIQAIDIFYQGIKIDEELNIIQLLYKYGANLNIKNDNNETPLDIVIKKMPDPYNEIKNFLRNLGAKTSSEFDQENKNQGINK